MHHEQIKLSRIVNQKLLKTRGEDMSGLLVRAISYVRHEHASFELPANSRVNTFWSAPARLMFVMIIIRITKGKNVRNKTFIAAISYFFSSKN